MTNDGILCYIHEQTSSPEDYKTSFGYEIHERGSRFFVTFKGILQSFGVTNRNNRSYMSENVMNLINTDPYIQDQLKRNTWQGEIDHPSPTTIGTELTINRISTPDLKMTSHYIRSPILVGNLLESNIQTDSSNEHGMNMAIKIVDGKITPAFSARVFGELKNISGKATVFVKKLITYDFVGFPSHPEALAKMNQPLVESVNMMETNSNSKIIMFDELSKMAANNSRETEWLCESFGLNINDVVGISHNADSVFVKESKNIYKVPITSLALRETSKKQLNEWLHQ